MIHFNIPSLYAGVYGMEVLLDVAQRHHPEMRRWVLREERDNGTRVLEDRQTEETVEIPQYHFAVFPAGNPVVIPYDLMSVLAPPNPRIVVPALDTPDQRARFAERSDVLTGHSSTTKIVVDGPRNEYVYLDFPTEYLYLPEWWSAGRPEGYYDRPRGRVRLSEGDTLFSYTYPKDINVRARTESGGVDYMPTSVVSSKLSIPAVEALDLTDAVYTQDWTQLWPKPKNKKEDTE